MFFMFIKGNNPETLKHNAFIIIVLLNLYILIGTRKSYCPKQQHPSGLWLD